MTRPEAMRGRVTFDFVPIRCRCSRSETSGGSSSMLEMETVSPLRTLALIQGNILRTSSAGGLAGMSGRDQ